MTYVRKKKRTQAQEIAQKAIFDNLWAFLEKYSRTNISKSSVLEFGSGRFGYIDLYKEIFITSYALDIYDFADSYDENVTFLISEDEKTIPLADRSVSLVVSHSVLEHVTDIEHTIREMNRVLKIGGTAYLTVSPLYWSGAGSHLYTKDRKRLVDWEHLDPDSQYFLETGNDIQFAQGGWLNKLTSSELLGAVGNVPWTIDRYETRADVTQKRPDFLKNYNVNKVDLHSKEFRLIATKIFDYDDKGIRVKN